MEVINSPDVKVEVTATNTTQTSTGSLFVGGAFMGNTVNGNKVVAKQVVNPQVLDKMSTLNGAPGQDMLHEVTEPYQGGKISLESKVSSPDSKTEGSVYLTAHCLVVPQSGAVMESVASKSNIINYSTSPYLISFTSVPQGFKPLLKVTF